jgi:acetoin utilization deacetylase AcuC-like enzyme
MKVYYSDNLLVPLPDGHRFPMPKYKLLHDRVVKANIPSLEMCASSPAEEPQVLFVHSIEYYQKVIHGYLTEKEMRRIGFPWSPELVNRSLHSIGGTIDACRSALQEGISANLAGGTHHAFPDHGEGYCVFNDVAIASRTMQNESRVNRVLILDCDVHQGNGTAAIFSADPSVFTFSVHGQKNFPFHKESSDLDIALSDDSGDETYLEAIHAGIPEAVRLAHADLVIYIAGADPYIGDRLGRMAMTKAGLADRDGWVLRYCREQDLPVSIVMGGGYARQIEDVVDINFQTLRIAAELIPIVQK